MKISFLLNILTIASVISVISIIIILFRFGFQIQKGISMDSPSSILKQWITVIVLTVFLSICHYIYPSKDNERNRKILLTIGLVVVLLLIMMGHYTIAISVAKGEDRDKYRDIYDYEKNEFISTGYKIMNYIGGFFFVIAIIAIIIFMTTRGYKY